MRDQRYPGINRGNKMVVAVGDVKQKIEEENIG